ncbi:hypothetical protein C2845_PM13G19380 [Panicum miliaceum]|uniref:Uncharacterized protein n=1 Tax=Panicum miliaceum TaxID=4540 RepID=A0A3L6RMZ7_PANMI|nr:hypothetical protein C2845_PM13G19380 [Panicum miliaceum]
MPHLRARAKAAAAPQGTPVPSPSTSLRLGLGPASPDDDGFDIKSPAAAPPRRSLRLAGAAASPTTPAAQDGGSSGSGPGSGSGGGVKRAGRPRALASASSPAAASPMSGNSGSGGGGAAAGGSGSGGAAPFMSLRSGSLIAKRRMEAGGEAGPWPSDGGQVHDEMPLRGAGTPTKRRRSVLVGGVETEYVADSESGSDRDCLMLGLKMARGMVLPRQATGKEKLVLGNNHSRAVGSGYASASLKLSTDSKGKGKMVVEDSLSSLSSSEDESDSEQVDSKEIQRDKSLSSLSSSVNELDSKPVDAKEVQSNSGSVSASVEPLRRQAARERAIRLAPKFAFFKADKDEPSEDDEEEELELGSDPQDWPGPFATAARIYEEREAKLRARESNSSKVNKAANKAIVWSPSKDKKNPVRVQAAPSLTSLCINTLAENSEGIESLGDIPEELKHKLLKILCHSRKMNTHLLNELLCDSPTELHLSECSWLSDDDFEKTFGKCKTDSLQDLQLDISGRCMPDYILPTTLVKAPNCMPLLTKISLKGNYRLSDKGLDTIISAAPSLSSLNLCECSLLTSSGIVILADKLHSVLRELYIDDCTNVDAMMILPALQKINHLEALSMSGIRSVCDKFVNELLTVHGSNMKELAFAGCSKLTSSSIKTIGQNCPQLTSLDLRNLNRLRDSAMRHLRYGCRLIRKLKLQRNTFSDEAVSRFLEESGGCLTELMLNNVEKVGDLTALAISRKCSVRLEALDLSFCRELTNEALGLIVDSCSSLRILKLFGCTQITDLFLKGHSNTSVQIIGIEGSILEQMDNR